MNSDTTHSMNTRLQMHFLICFLTAVFCFFFGFTHVSYAAVTNGLVGRWTFDTKDMTPNVRDVSGQGKHGQLSGYTSTTTIPGKIQQGLSFASASSQYVDMGNQSSLQPGSGDFTVSVWFKTSTTQFAPLVSKRVNGGNYDQFNVNMGRVDSCGVGTTAQGSITFFAKNTSGDTSTSYSTNNTSYADGKWHHAVAVYTAGGTVAIYMDGAAAATTRDCSQGALGAINPSANFQLGYNNGSTYYNGALDDVRVYNRALSASEARQIYLERATSKINTTSNASPDLNRGKVVHWTFDGKSMYPNVRDISGSGYHGQLAGFTGTTTMKGQVGQGLSFNGSTNYITTTNNTIYQTFTYSLWVKPEANAGMGLQEILSKRSYCANSTSDFPTALNLNAAGTIATVHVDGGGDYSVDLSTASGAFSTGVWHHIVATYNGSQLIMYVDGKYSNSSSGSVTLSNNTGTYWTIGKQSIDGGGCGAGTAWFKGGLDDVRIYSRALSAEEVKLLYGSTASGKANTTLPMPKIGQGGLVGHWTFDGKYMYPNVRDASGAGNHGQLSGFTSTTTRPGKIGQALTFDGSDDYVDMGTTASLNPSAMTISAWVKPQTGGPVLYSIVTRNQNGGSRAYEFYLRPSNLQSELYINGGLVLTGPATTANVWTHLAVTVNATRSVLYVNGAQYTTGSGATIGSVTDQTMIGDRDDTTFAFKGSLDDVRLYNVALSAQEVKQLYKSATSVMR